MNSITCLAILLSFTSSAYAIDESLVVRRIHAHLLLKDFQTALDEIEEALRENSRSKALLRSQIEVLAATGDSRMLERWEVYTSLFPEEKSNRELMETMAWGILAHGAHSPALATRTVALLGASMGNDARGVALLAEGMRSNNALMRGLCAQIAGEMRDESLREQICRMIKEESAWSVRLQAISSAGSMGITAISDSLEAIVADVNSHAEEKAAAIEALTSIVQEVESEKIQTLVTSNRAGLRQLACELLAARGQREQLPLLLPLIDDHHGDIRAAALQVFSLLVPSTERKSAAEALARRKILDTDPYVSLSAAWLLMPVDAEMASKTILRWISDPKQETRLLASGVLASSGSYALPAMQQVLQSSQDPYVCTNVAMGMLALRDHTDLASKAISSGLSQQKERWMWKKRGFYRYIAPSTLEQREGVSNYPEAASQLVRLELLNALAMIKSPEALPAITTFLKDHTWGIGGLAASLLLTEGTSDALNLIRDLLNDSNKKIRLQAALALAVWGRDPLALETLQSGYGQVDFNIKAGILEALGAIGHEKSIPFLMQRLKDPSQQIRLVAAASLIACLNK